MKKLIFNNKTNKKESNNFINEEIKSRESFQDKRFEKKLVDILLSVGIPASLQGYHFLKETIKLAVKNPNYIGAITKVMYPKIATKFETTACRVERSIRHALDVAYSKGKIIHLNDIFGLDILDENERPTNSEFVALIADKLNIEFKDK